jgi:hypothetical protein
MWRSEPSPGPDRGIDNSRVVHFFLNKVNMTWSHRRSTVSSRRSSPRPRPGRPPRVLPLRAGSRADALRHRARAQAPRVRPAARGRAGRARGGGACAAGVGRIVHVNITNPSEDSPLEYFSGKARFERELRASGCSGPSWMAGFFPITDANEQTLIAGHIFPPRRLRAPRARLQRPSRLFVSSPCRSACDRQLTKAARRANSAAARPRLPPRRIQTRAGNGRG